LIEWLAIIGRRPFIIDIWGSTWLHHNIREAENLFTSKWHCLDFIWSVINYIYPFLSHFDLMKSQKSEIEPVIWKGSRTHSNDPVFNLLLHYRSKWFKKE
jgi:hypothetical protein